MPRSTAAHHTAEHAATTAAVAAAAPASFLVYPMPSIADESLLQLIFRQHVKRSLFFGFGRNRMAIAELDSAEVAHSVERALKAGPTAASSPENTKKATQTGKKKNSAAAAAGKSVEEVEAMTLADMFATSQTMSQDSNKNNTDSAPATDAAAALQSAALDDFSHLPCLAFRGRPLHVVVSGVQVADFYATGGAVPEKHESKEDRSSSKKKARKATAAGGDDKDATATAAVGQKRQREGAGDEEDGTAAGEHAKSAGNDRQQAAAKFPKNACQKCGSVDHFTRHCDGSGAPASASADAAVAKTAAATTTADAEKESARTHGNSDVAHNAPTRSSAHPAAAPQYPKDCCQKCGSKNHFTRHCDGSGVATTVAPEKKREDANVSANAGNDEKPATAVTRTNAAVAAAAAADVVVKVEKTKPAVIQRSSKDQCKFCGSDAHLSRHCPSK